MPVRPGMLSLDTRSRDIVAALEGDGRGHEMAVETGRPPGSGRPVTLLLWMLANEEASVRAARWILFTNWIKLRLTGRATTDFSDASAGLLSRSRPEYARSLLDRLGLAEILPKLPEIVPSAEVAGVISAEAAEATGLRPGVPVASGSHDASASVIGTGALGADAICLIAGTWSIDIMVSHQPSVSAAAAARGVHGRWFADGARTTLFSSSPSGAPLLDKFLEPGPAGAGKDLLAGLLGPGYHEGGPSRLPTVVPSVRGPGPSQISGAMVLGLDPAHDPADVAAALAEAIAFRHRLGYELIGGEVAIAEVRTTRAVSPKATGGRSCWPTPSVGRWSGRSSTPPAPPAPPPWPASRPGRGRRWTRPARRRRGGRGRFRPLPGTKNLSRRTLRALPVGPRETGGMAMILFLGDLAVPVSQLVAEFEAQGYIGGTIAHQWSLTDNEEMVKANRHLDASTGHRVIPTRPNWTRSSARRASK